MPQRKPRGKAGDKTICLPITDGLDYSQLVESAWDYRAYLDHIIEWYPELFPPEIHDGYRLHGFVESKRQHLKTRRIFLRATQSVYQIRPDFVMPYMSKTVDGAEKASLWSAL